MYRKLIYIIILNKRPFIRDIKPVYKAATKEAAEMALDELEAQWGEKYPKVIESKIIGGQTIGRSALPFVARQFNVTAICSAKRLSPKT